MTLKNLPVDLSTSGMINFSRKSETKQQLDRQVLKREVLLFVRFNVKKDTAQEVVQADLVWWLQSSWHLTWHL